MEHTQPLSIKIQNRFLLTTFVSKISNYIMYEGLDLKLKTQVIVFVKISRATDVNRFPVGLHSKLQCICPSVVESGEQKIEKVVYKYYVVEKYGPSLKQVFKILNYKLPVPTVFLYAYNILKILEKFAECGLVSRNLKLSKLFLSKTPNKSNTKKIDQTAPKKQNKYSSIGAHLGLKTSLKDDLQSLCYIMFNLFSGNQFFKRTKPNLSKVQYYLSLKTNINFEEHKYIPVECINFYNYARNISNSQIPNFEYWKNVFKQCVLGDSNNSTLNQIKTTKSSSYNSKAKQSDKLNFNDQSQQTFNDEESVDQKIRLRSVLDSKFKFTVSMME